MRKTQPVRRQRPSILTAIRHRSEIFGDPFGPTKTGLDRILHKPRLRERLVTNKPFSDDWTADVIKKVTGNRRAYRVIILTFSVYRSNFEK